jgi:hypothetical protein
MQRNLGPGTRIRFSAATVVAALAVVFAISGGAYAAGYLITSIHQISPRVVKQLRGQRGPRGREGPPGQDGKPGAPGATGQGPAFAVWNDAGTHTDLMNPADNDFHSVATLRIPAAGMYVAVAKVESYVQSGSGVANSLCRLTALADGEGGSGEYDDSFASLQSTVGVNDATQTQAMEVTHSFTGPGTVALKCQQNGVNGGGAYVYWSKAKIIATRVSALTNTVVSS